jgi:integrase
VQPARPAPDFRAIAARKVYISSLRFASKYGINKIRKCEELSEFLPFVVRDPVPTFFDCLPGDIVDFLIYSSSNGVTTVHDVDCPRLRACSCPVTKAAGSVDSEIGMLRGGFNIIGRYGVDNPAAHPLVLNYLADIRWEQARAGVVPTKAVPVFQEKLIQLCAAADRLLAGDSLDPQQRYTLLRDVAGFCLVFASGTRGNDLGYLRVSEILQFPGGDGLMFGFTFGKTLRGGSTHVFGIRTRPDLLLVCPIARIMAFMQHAATYGPHVLAPGAYLFHPWRDGPMPASPLAARTLNDSLVYQLTRLSIFDGETFHGFRAAFAIESAIEGHSLAEICAGANWSGRGGMAERYMCMQRVLMMAPADIPMTSQLYQDVNELQHFVRAFPTRRV